MVGLPCVKEKGRLRVDYNVTSVLRVTIGVSEPVKVRSASSQSVPHTPPRLEWRPAESSPWRR